MATTYQVKLVGGPCDGTIKKLTVTQFQSHHTTCSGQTYIYNALASKGQPEPVFEYQAQASTGSGGQDQIAPKTHSGWRDLKNMTKNNVHASLKQSHSSTSAALRDLAKLPKMRKR